LAWRLREVGLQQVLVWALGTLVASALVFGGVSRWFSSHEGEPGGFLFRIHRFETDMAADAYRTGGAAGLAAYGKKLERQMGGKRYFTDVSGKDLLTGDVRPEAAGELGAEIRHPFTPNAEITLVGESSEGTLRMISRIPPPLPMSTFLPYLGIVVPAIALLCWPLAANLARPLHTLAQSVDRFGQGDLAVRMGSARRDEIGDLARSFDRMADRIATLLTAKRRLLQDVSHELRSPLAHLSFAAELGRTSGDRDLVAARIRREVNRLSSLVGTLLEMTRAEGDPASWVRRPVLLRDLVQEIAEDCGVEAAASGVSIQCELTDAEVAGDAEWLPRAIENVVRNAVHHSPAGGQVDISMRQADRSIAILVRDYGPGVPEGSLARIFQPFFRIDDARSDQTGGMGLGLAIARRAVSVHQGSIGAESECTARTSG
jgi:signal transduction histidine kinase